MQQVLASAPRSLQPLPAAAPVKTSVCEELVLRVQAIWNAISAFICEWACYLLSFIYNPGPRKEFIANPLSQCSPDLFNAIAKYLEPEDVARLERVSPAVKASIQSQEERLWKSQYDFNGVSYTPQSGRYKDAFAYPYPEMAFGPREWIRYWGDPGTDLPRLSSVIHRTLAKHPEIKDNYVLTFCPATLDGRCLTLNYFRERVGAPREGIPVRFDGEYHCPVIFKRCGEKPIEKACWLLMQKEVPTRTVGITPWNMQLYNMNYRMGSALEVAVSISAALFYPKTCCLLGVHPSFGGSLIEKLTRTRDDFTVQDRIGTVAVQGPRLSDYDPAQRHYSLSFHFLKHWSEDGRMISNGDTGIAECFAVTQEALHHLQAAF